MFGVRERLLGSRSSVSGIWVLEVQLRSSALVVRAFTHWATSPAPGYSGLKRMNKLPTDILNMAWIPKTPKTLSVRITVEAGLSRASLCTCDWYLLSELTPLTVCFCCTFPAKGNADLQKVMERVKAVTGERKVPPHKEPFLLVLLLCFATGHNCCGNSVTLLCL